MQAATGKWDDGTCSVSLPACIEYPPLSYCKTGFTSGDKFNGHALTKESGRMYLTTSNQAIALADSSFTVAFWARRNLCSALGYPVHHGGESGDGVGPQYKELHIGFRANNAFTCAFWAADLNYATTCSDDVNRWFHWTCTFSTSNKARVIYRLGLEVASDTVAANYQGPNSPIDVGWMGSGNTIFDGSVDELRIWKRTLTYTEVYALFARNQYSDTNALMYHTFTLTPGQSSNCECSHLPASFGFVD